MPFGAEALIMIGGVAQLATISTAPVCGIVNVALFALVLLTMVTPGVVVSQLTKVYPVRVPAAKVTDWPLLRWPETVWPFATAVGQGMLLVMLSCRWAGCTVTATVWVSVAPRLNVFVASIVTLKI